MSRIEAVAQTAPSEMAPPTEKAAPSKPPLNPALFKLFGNYGGWWNYISEAEKDAFIDGYTSAMDVRHG